MQIARTPLFSCRPVWLFPRRLFGDPDVHVSRCPGPSVRCAAVDCCPQKQSTRARSNKNMSRPRGGKERERERETERESCPKTNSRYPCPGSRSHPRQNLSSPLLSVCPPDALSALGLGQPTRKLESTVMLEGSQDPVQPFAP